MYQLILTLFLLKASISWALSEQEIEAFAHSKQWLRLLYYSGDKDHYKSKVQGPYYFIDKKNGSTNPILELKATIKALKENQKGTENESYRCRFPARKIVLNRQWPGLLSYKDNCKDLNEWLTNIDAGQLYLVYSSAYPNNPASMFGHTFLRFDRKNRSKNTKTNELLGYSMAYQAKTDPADNALIYTMRGIFGGYYAGVEIKPHYINIGMYNNSESRDLWEYPINLSEAEKNLMLNHLWEVSTSVGFNYYFFDENCSTNVLRLMKVIKIDWDFSTLNDMFVVPQQTLKELVAISGNQPPKFRPSIKKQILHRFVNFNSDQQAEFSMAKNDIEVLKNIKDPEILDTLVDYWKFQNYKAKANLNPENSKLMQETYLRRTQYPKSDLTYLKQIEDEFSYQNPYSGYNFKRINFRSSSDSQDLSFRYGFHDFLDPVIGYDPKANIKFFDINLHSQDETLTIDRFELLEILSLQNFYWHFPQISWKINITSYNLENFSYLNLQAGVGLARSFRSGIIYSLISTNILREYDKGKTLINPGAELGFKYYTSNKSHLNLFMQNLRDFDETFHTSATLRYFYPLTSINIVPEINYTSDETKIYLGLSTYFN